MKMKHRSNKKVLNNFAEVKGDASFLDFAGYDGVATTAEKNAAMRGAAARGTFGAKRDQCKRGKSCGAACIFYRKDCILELPEAVQPAMRAARAYIQRLATSGKISAEEAESTFMRTTGLGSKTLSPDLDLSQASRKANPAIQGKLDAALKEGKLKTRYEEIKRELDNVIKEAPSVKEGKKRATEAIALALTQAHGKRQGSVEGVTLQQQEGLKAPKQQELFRRGQDVFEKTQKGEYKNAQEFNEATKKALNPVHGERDPSPAETRLLLAAMHPELNKALLTKGDIEKGIGLNGKELPYWGTSEPTRNTPTIPKPANMTPEQEKEIRRMALEGNRFQIAHTFLATKGIDPYTGLRLQLHNSDLEHFIPENASKGWANSGGNRILTASAINQSKANLSFEKSLYAGSGNRMYGQTGDSPKRALLKELDSGTITAARALATAGNLPKGAMDAKAWKEFNSAITLNLTKGVDGKGVVQAVSVGMTGGGKNNNQGWYLFGGKEGSGWDPKLSAELGGRIASKLASWEGQGREGAMKINNLTRTLLQVQSQVRDINKQDWQGTPISQIGFKQNPEAKRYVENQIKSIMEQNMSAIEGALSL
jgi:hypothetical protein